MTSLNQFPVLPVLDHVIAGTKQRLDDVMIVAVQHLLDTTGSLLEGLLNLGVVPNNVHLIGKLYSTNDSVQKKLAAIGINVYENSVSCPWLGFSRSFGDDLDKLWSKVVQDLRDKRIRRLVVLDDGGKCIARIPKEVLSARNNCFVVAVEQTTGGLHNGELCCPLVRVADSAAKIYLESPLIASATFTKLQQLKLAECFGSNSRFGVIGAGNIGRAIAAHLTLLGANFLIHDCNGEMADTFPDNWCKDTATLVSETNVVFGCTGEDVFCGANWIEHIKGEHVFVSCSSEDREFLSLLERDVRRSRSGYDPLRTVQIHLTAGTLTITRGGFPINFDGSAESVPAMDIQLTRGLLLGGVIQAATLHVTGVENKSMQLDAYLQASIARKWFESNLSRRHDELADRFCDPSWIASHSGGT